ncbi:hypothetical protein BC831DRAFT_450925 [Entophlyctis helioformis]|nr:hypothetical protein BC831DRAFT_450925 [Entophlyctis helioformis]
MRASLVLTVLASLAPLAPLGAAVPVQSYGAQQALQSDPFAMRLIALSETQQQWMTEEQIFALYRSGTKFIDVTDGDMDLIASIAGSRDVSAAPVAEYPSRAAFQDTVQPILTAVSPDNMKDFLTRFSGFKTRYFRSGSGAESCQWLFDQVQDLADTHGRSDIRLSVSKFTHAWDQFTVIARLEPASASASSASASSAPEEIIVVSAHQDSVNQFNPYFGRSPGADDDGSGSTTIFEALTRLVKSGSFVPVRPIEFHWYSAEEGGLLGSQKVVASYIKNEAKTRVIANFHNDMTGYQPSKKKPVVGISTDFVNPKLTKFLELITETYSEIPWVHTKCGYACSDHATWTKAGVPAVFTFEAPFADHSPYIHTTEDTVDSIDFGHMAQFVRGVIGFAVELSLAK